MTVGCVESTGNILRIREAYFSSRKLRFLAMQILTIVEKSALNINDQESRIANKKKKKFSMLAGEYCSSTYLSRAKDFFLLQIR